MNRSISIILAQLNWLVGDIEGNTQRMLATIEKQKNAGADLVMFSELALCGYPPEDLLYRLDFYQRCEQKLAQLEAASKQVAILIGHPWQENNKCYNAVSLFADGTLLGRYFKQILPNRGAFDEKRYFNPGNETAIFNLKGYALGLLIGEDLWLHEPINALQAAGAEIVLSINASPYDNEILSRRHTLMVQHCQRTALPLIYLNQIGGQDELLFDGSSSVFSASGMLTHRLASFTEQITRCQFQDLVIKPMATLPAALPVEAQIYRALVLSLRDYAAKNGFQDVILGLSGGIDSALTLAIAVDALGKEHVNAVMMPFRYTAPMSIDDAQQAAALLDVRFTKIEIEPIFEAYIAQLRSLLVVDTQGNTTEENLQARCRGMLLMALSNNHGSLVLTTSNKSEMAVGYATLYGDMVGGFAVLKDQTKTSVYRLARYRNSISAIIPQRILARPPSAELAPDQRDEDYLPPYPILDRIIVGYIHHDKSLDTLIMENSHLLSEDEIRHVIQLIDTNEYKRYQSAPGPRTTRRNFGKDRRYPITSGFGLLNWSLSGKNWSLSGKK